MKESERLAIETAQALAGTAADAGICFGTARNEMSASGKAQLAACELLRELGRCDREERPDGTLRFSNFWFGEGERPSTEKWLAAVTKNISGCDGSGHHLCCISQAAAIAKEVEAQVVAPVVGTTEQAMNALRWVRLMAGLERLSKDMPVRL